MDEEVGANAAPVTRLRRRLSVDPEDSPLPTTPSTPTKKRSTRLAAKPQLDLIDEVDTGNVPKRSTRKAVGKETETDAGTPTPVTPSRRSTRIRSNTSILSETITQSIESPRAKRALRRTSQLGSDTESTAVVTPARQPRKTRKDSTTSVDKQAVTDQNVGTIGISKINSETIIESEKEFTETTKENETSSSTIRKSPRLNKKGGKTAAKKEDAINELDNNLNTSKQDIYKPTPTDIVTNTSNLKEYQNKTDSTKAIQNKKENLSTSFNKDYPTDAKNSSLNNSTSDKEKVTDALEIKRNRTKSWTTLSSPLVGSSSENETTKQKLLSSSADIEPLLNSPNRSLNKSKSSFLDTLAENKENLDSHVLLTKYEINKSDTGKLFEKSPDDQNLMLLMEDSDSGCGNHQSDIQLEGEDQCVPIGKSQNESPEKFSQGAEPMDIDESVLANATFDDFSDKSTDSKDIKEESEISDSKRKSSVSEKSLTEDGAIKSKRKSSVSIPVEVNNDSKILKSKKSVSHDADKTDGNKSRISLASLNADNEQKLDLIAEKSQRKSSISLNVSEANQSKDESIKSINKSLRKSSVSNSDKNDAKLDETLSKSERKSSISINISNRKNEPKISHENSSRKLSISANDENGEKLNESFKKSNRKSSISDNIEKRNDSSSERKSSISESILFRSYKDENNDSKILNKSKKKSFVQTESLEKSGNENKSTLVISQLKDVSNDTNVAMSPNVTNNEFSKSLNGPEIKNKGISNKNLSMNCLTSTPIQQKPLQKLGMQINTSIISPTVNRGEAIEKTKLNISNKNISGSHSSQDEMDNIKPTKEADSASKKSVVASSSPDSSDSESKTDSRNRSKKFTKKSPAKTQTAYDNSESSDEESEINIKNKINGNDSKGKGKNDNSSVDSSDSDEVSKDKSGMLDDEASEASDDYVSGDSRDEEERRYEAENEIVDKGETLDSDEDLSNDSDYEKDSFLVSSDAEDSEMLSGTGDDLSMSDNELNMSAKSKKKFNDRKIKQQKKASREMYEARHNNDESSNATAEYSKSTKTKKSKRQRLESSTLESDTEKPKEINKLRIDSSQDRTDDETIGIKKKTKRLSESVFENQTTNEKDVSMSKVGIDESIGIKKKKSKRLSESICEDQIMNEKEISINKVDANESILIGKKKKSKRLSESMCHDITINEKEITLNQSTTKKNDPLSAAIKQEPKTPLKFDISTVAINEDVEEIQVDSNKSLVEQNVTTDPLHVTMAADNDIESSRSDEGEFVQNYDSVLSNLGKHTKIIKTLDASLDLNKKAKKSKDPVIDQLNLTQTKTFKKNKKDNSGIKSPVKVITEDVKKNKKDNSGVKSPVKVITEDAENSSDSIDMKLLFPEDSNDSEVHASQFKPEEPVDFIPLKRTEAKTNILENMDRSISLNESALNVSKKKEKNRKLSQCIPEEQPMKLVKANEQEDTNIKIIIDTTGTHHELDESQPKSSKKKKNKNKSLNESMADTGEIDCTDGIAKTPIETFFTTENKKKNKNKSLNMSANIDKSSVEDNYSVKSHNKTTKNPKSISELVETQIENTDNTIIQETPANVSVKSDKKKKKKTDVSQNIEPVELNTSAEKKSKKSMGSEPVIIETEATSTDISMASEKKKKKKTKNLEVSQIVMDNTEQDSDEAPMEISYKSQKKSHTTGDTDKVHMVEQSGEGTTNRKRKASNNLPTAPKDDANFVSITNEKKILANDQYLDNDCIAAYDLEQGNGDGKSKKNIKVKQQDNVMQEEIEHKPRKRKNRHDESHEKISKISKQSLFDEVHVPILPESILNQLTDKRTREKEPKRNRTSKKKAARAISTAPFVVEEVLKRKNKPSNYLEQSVYLNESPEKEKKNKYKQKIPKVLPFTPTAVTSESGYTSKFNINVLPNETQFVAQSSNVHNFKEAFLGNQRIKKMGTLERCKIQRSHKLSKF